MTREKQLPLLQSLLPENHKPLIYDLEHAHKLEGVLLLPASNTEFKRYYQVLEAVARRHKPEVIGDHHWWRTMVACSPVAVRMEAILKFTKLWEY